MVADAPKFYEVAKQVVELTQDTIFVAHNARFDYSFIREEFKRLGYTYTRKQLCTVRLSRQVFPGLGSYGLSSLCRTFNIPNHARHRAMGDAAATTILLELILHHDQNQDNVNDLINLGIKESLLPENLNVEKIHGLPDQCGVYYFHNQKGEVVYVGKSINIKKRVAQHFSKKTEKASKLQHHVYEISYELTGSELVAFLLESYEIKRLRPPINRAQKMRFFPFVIYTWHNKKGYRCFGMGRVNAKEKKKLQVLSEFPRAGSAKGALERARVHFELCSHFMQKNSHNSACFHFHLNQCHGACGGFEPVETYNERADQAAEYLTTIFEKDFFILDVGRETNELAVVQVKDGNYTGFGYIDKESPIDQIQELENAVKAYPNNPETRKLIQRFLAREGNYKVIEY